MFVKSLVLCASALASTVLGMGSVNIKNKCTDPIYYQSIAGDDNTPVKSIQPNQDYSEQFRKNTATGGGISIKVSKTKDQTPGKIAQVEYTLQKLREKSMVFYDLSYVNGNPFAKDGVTITPSDGGCPTVNCPPGQEKCPDAYNKPDDDKATHGCSQEADFEVIFCSGGSTSGKRDAAWQA